MSWKRGIRGEVYGDYWSAQDGTGLLAKQADGCASVLGAVTNRDGLWKEKTYDSASFY